MAVFRIVGIGYNKTENAMYNLCNYILDDTRHTINGMIGGTYLTDTTIDGVYDQMMRCKWHYKKMDGRMAGHFVISFSADEMQYLKLDQIHMIAREFCGLFFGYQMMYAIHQEKDHIHIHFMINTVSFVDGKKLQISPYEVGQIAQKVHQIIGRYIPHNLEERYERANNEYEVCYSTVAAPMF